MRGTQVFETIVGRPRRIAALILAFAMLVSVPIGAFLALDGSDSQAPPSADGEQGAATSMPEAPAANLDLVRDSLAKAAEARDIDLEPVPPPEPAAHRPLHHAIDRWLETQHAEVPDDLRKDAHEQVDDVPATLREPLARLLLAHAEATELQREALEPLSEQERQRIQALAEDEAALAATLEDPPPWLVRAADRIDLARSFQAAHLLVDAADGSVPELREHTDGVARGSTAAAEASRSPQTAPPALLRAVADTPVRDLPGLEDFLATLAGSGSLPNPPAADPLSDQLARLSSDTSSPPVEQLPPSLDGALGKLWLSSTAGAHVLAAQGPDVLLEAHLLRVRAIQETAPTLDAWGKALDAPGVDSRQLARPSLAAGQALDRSAHLPAPDAGAATLLSFAIDTSVQEDSSSKARDPVVALDHLYQATPSDPPPGWRSDARATFDGLDADQRRGLAILFTGLAQARTQVDQALSDLDRNEIELLQARRGALSSFLSGEQLHGDRLTRALEALSLARKADGAQMASAAVTAASAVDRARPLLQATPADEQAAGDTVPKECPREAPMSDCDKGILFEDPLGLVVLGSAHDSVHESPVESAPVVLLDLGGNDTYERPVADSSPFRPLSVGADLGGEDEFTSSATGQGRGFLGVGLLLQAGGDTSYSLTQQGQGFANLGPSVGALLDLGGDDTYDARAFAQGASQPLSLGSGVLVDVEGDDSYSSPRGIGYALGGTFLDLGGRDSYDVAELAHGARLDQGVDLDDVPDRVFQNRRDNALWLDGSFTLDTGFGLDVQADELDHDGDLFPSLVEMLADSDAGSSAQTPVDRASDVAETGEDGDGDGSPNAVEEGAGTDPANGTEGPLSMPRHLPMAPAEIRTLYQTLRGEYTQAPPPNGLLLDIRMPLQDSTGYECTSDAFPVCLTASGPGEDTASARADSLNQFSAGAISILSPNSPEEASAKTQSQLGLLAVGAPSNSTFELPYLLTVDLGGDDTYEHGAGGAITVETEQENDGNEGFEDVAGSRRGQAFIPTTGLDLGGSDTYEGSDLAQGAGGGVLVDLGHGDETYEGDRSTQGAKGGLLFDEHGDDVYRAGHGSQAAAVPSFGYAAPVSAGNMEHVELAIQTAHEGAGSPSLRPSLLVDAAGDDLYRSGASGQAYAGMTPGNATLTRNTQDIQAGGAHGNETMLLAGLVDERGSDTYLGGARTQAVSAPNGIALLADRAGDDRYQAGGLVSQAGIDARTLADTGTSNSSRLPGLALLADARGGDTYTVHPTETTNRSRTEDREGNVTRERLPLGPGRSQVSPGGVRLTAIEAVHADLQASTRDGDGDNWIDPLEQALGTDETDSTSSPTATPLSVVQGGRVLDLPRAGLVVGGVGDDTYSRDAVLAIDLGGDNVYENNAGGPILDPLAHEVNVKETQNSEGTGTGDVSLFQHPVTAVVDASDGSSTFEAPRGLSQGSGMFTVGTVLTAGGENRLNAAGEPRTTAEVPEGPRATLDGLLGPKEYPHTLNVTWLPETDPARERSGSLGVVHDGRSLYLSARIPDAQRLEDGPHPEVSVYMATFNETPTLIDRLDVTPHGSGRVDDRNLDENLDWRSDGNEDPNETRARMGYVDGGWTVELERPLDEPYSLTFESPRGEVEELVLDLCQPTNVVKKDDFNSTKIRDLGRRVILTDPVEDDGDTNDRLRELESDDEVEIQLKPDDGRLAFRSWHFTRTDGQKVGGEEVDDGCRLFRTEDVSMTPGTPRLLFVEFEDPTTGETWRYPPTGTAEDGARAFHEDGSLDDELAGWLPVFPQAPLTEPLDLRTGPRITQGSALGGVGLVASVSTGTGNDTYRGFRQAQGYGAAGGTGLLVDLGGPDTYRIDSQGQGYARVDDDRVGFVAREGGYGLLLDHRGNDIYHARAQAQGHSPDASPRASPVTLGDIAGAGLLSGVQARAVLADLGGYDRYDLEEGPAETLVPLPAPPDEDYEIHEGNDRVWRQDRGGLGIDTALASHGPRSTVGDSTLADVGVDAWPASDDGECPREEPPAGDRLSWHVNHSVRLVEDKMCLAVTVEDPIVDNVPLRRVEVLRNGEREIVQDVQTPENDALSWPLSSDETLLVFPVNTTQIPDGFSTWRVIAYFDAPQSHQAPRGSTWGPMPPVIAEDSHSLAVSNPPTVDKLEPRERFFSPTPAVGEPGLQIDAEVSEDLSEHARELAGYGKSQENIPCPFDADRLCNRYTLYLGDGEMTPHRPDGVIPRIERQDPGNASKGSSYAHELRAPFFLPGGRTVGVVEDKAPDAGVGLDGGLGLETVARAADGTLYALDRSPTGPQANVQQGDLRLSSTAGRPPGTVVLETDPDRGDLVSRVNATVATTDADGWQPGEALYLDVASPNGTQPRVDAGDLRLLTPNATANVSLHNLSRVEAGDADTTIDVNNSTQLNALHPQPELNVTRWQAADLDGSGSTLSGNDTVYIDADSEGPGDSRVSAGDIRLGRTNLPPGASAELAYYHKALYQGEVTVHANLATASSAFGGPPDPTRATTNQTHPIVAEAFHRGLADPAETTATEPRGDERQGFSRLLLPMDTTRRYPTETGGENTYLNLTVRTKGSPTFGVEEGAAFTDSRATPSRLHLYMPAGSDQRAVLNASLVGVGENWTHKENLIGGEERQLTWPAEDAPDGLYNLSLAAFDIDPSLQAKATGPTKRWSPHLEGPTVRVDSRPPEANVALPDYIGASALDVFSGSFEIPWNVTDASTIEELRVYAAPHSAPDDAWTLVERVRDPDSGSVDYAFDQGEKEFRLAVVAMDEAGNVQGVEENLWPTRWPDGGRCPERVENRSVDVWPAESDAVFPDLNQHCFQSRSAALKAAFRIGLREQPFHVVTLDESKPFINETEIQLPDRDGPREVRVDNRAVTGLAAGENAIPRACVTDEGPAPISEVNFFMIRPGPNGTTIERSHELNATDTPGCYAFEDLDAWTSRAELYPQGFWTAGFEAVDRADNTARSFLGTVYLDTEGPNLTEGGLHLPPGQTAVMPDQRLTVDAEAQDPTGIAAASLSAPAFNQSATVELGVEDGRVRGELAIDRPVDKGIYDVYLNVTDALGNTRVVHRAIPVNMTPTSFAQAPNLTELAPTAQEETPVSTIPGGFGVTFETTTPSRFRVLAGPDAASLTPVYRERGNFTTEHATIVQGLAPGTIHTVRIVAFSAGGDLARSDAFTVRTGPAFDTEIHEPEAGAVLGPDARVTWSTTLAENASVSSKDLSTLVSVRRSADDVFRPVGGRAVDAGNASMELDLSTFATGRNYSLKVETVAGDQRGAAVVEPLVIDTAAPSLTLEAPSGGWTNQTSPTVELRLDDALGGLSDDPVVDVRLDGERGGVRSSTDGGVVSVRTLGDLEPGSHRIELVVEDRVGNRASHTVPLVVDRQGPVMHVRDAPDAAARPGGEISFQVFTRDDGRLATVEAHLGSQTVRANDPGGLDHFTVPIPANLGEQAPLRIVAEDAAGNRVTETRSIAIDDRAPRILDMNTTVDVSSVGLTLEASEPVRLVAAGSGQLTVSPTNDTHDITVTGLQPDARHRLELRASDEAGHTVRRTVTVHTLPDRSPPSPPSTVAVQHRADGSIAVEWPTAEDDGAIAFYRVARTTADGPGWRSLDRTSDTRLVDSNVEPGTTYEYRVQAVDTVGKTSGPRDSPTVTALATPELVDADVSPVEEAADTYAFEVTYRHPGGQAPDAVRLVLDGSSMPMEPVETSTAEEGTRYRTTVQLDPHTPTGSHAYRFEVRASDPPMAASLPQHGNFTGPLVSTLDDRGVVGNPIPGGPGLAALGLLLAAWAAVPGRRD